MMRSIARKKVSLAVLVSCILFLVELSAQQYPFKSFSTDDGLPQSSVYSLCEDRRGYLWIGTDGGGLSLMDGNGISIIDSVRSLESETIRALLLDSHNVLWIGTDKGIVSFDGYSFRKIAGPGPELQVLCFYEDSGSTLWVGTANEGCFYMENETLNRVEEVSSNAIFDIDEDEYGRIWLGSFGGGIYMVTRNHDGCIVERPDILLQNKETAITTIEKVEGDEFLLGTYGSGIKRVKIHSPGEVLLTDYHIEKIDNEDLIIWDILKTSGQGIWIATDKRGILRINKDGVTQMDHSNGLNTNQVLKLYEDRHKNIWLGTGDIGLSLYLGDEWVRFDYREFSEYPVSTFLKISENEFWVSTSGGGIHALRFEEDKTLLRSGRIFPNLDEDYVTALCRDAEGTTWLGSQQNGLYRVDPYTRTRITPEDGLISNKIYSIHADHEGRLWCGTDAGISVLDGSRILNLSENSDSGLINNEVQCFVQDKYHNLWIGTLGGIVRIHGNQMTDYAEEDGLGNTRVLTMELQYDSIVWIGTKGGGIYRCRDFNDSIPIEQVHYKKEFVSNNIRALKFLNDTLLAAGTDRGVMMFRLNGDSEIVYMRIYDDRDGFLGGEVIQNGIETAWNNQMLIATNTGIELFSPDLSIREGLSVSVHINQMDLFYSRVDWGSYCDSLIPFTQIPYDLELKPHENYLTFHLASDHLSGKSDVLLSYKLGKGDENWSPFQNIARVDFMNLPFGSNVLEIKAESEDDLLQHQSAAYEFMVQAPFYLKWWFYAGIFLFLIAAVMMIVRYRVRTLKKQNILLEDTVQKRTLAITWQKEQIEAQKDEIEAQMDEIEAQRNQIEIQRDLVVSQNREITASISYAQRIQEAVLPSNAYMTEVMPEHFVLYKPRDIVSGDFYWIRRIKNYLVVVAADCTGHGVPGAFMSMLGISFLNEQVSKSRMDPPGEILNRLRKKVKDTLSQQGKVEEQKDGMDMALAMIDMEEKELEFGGAYNPLYLIRKAAASDDHLMKYFALEVDGYRLYDLKGDRQPVGIYSMESDFSTKKIKLLEGDTIYLFSDGFADQVGGPRNKKFMSRNFKKTLLSIHHLSMKEQKKHLDDTLENWRGNNEQVDDILVMGMRM